MTRPPPEDDSPTLVLKKYAPVWWWVRKNFSFPAVITILSILAGAGGYIISLKTRVVVIEREVHDIKEVVPDATAVATLRTRVDTLESRTARLEKNWDDAANTAGTAPRPTRPRR